MSDQNLHPTIQDEISFKNIVDFLVKSWKGIILSGFWGLVASIAYLWVTPNQYQATAKIQMAQKIVNHKNFELVNVEDSNLLIIRLGIPTVYSAHEIKSCGFETSATPSESLLKSLKFSVSKLNKSVIEITANLNDKETTIICLQTLFEKVRASQNEIIKPYIEDAKISLLQYQDRLTNLQRLISQADKSGSALSATYLFAQGEFNFVTEEISRLNTLIQAGDISQAKLIAPIYTHDEPVVPKKIISLFAGLFAGLFLGLLLRLGKLTYKAYKVSN